MEKLTFTFTLSELNLIIQHLAEGKHKDVSPLLGRIVSEGQAQLQANQGPVVLPDAEKADKAVKKAIKKLAEEKAAV